MRADRERQSMMIHDCHDFHRRVLMDVANELRDKGALGEAECFIDCDVRDGEGWRGADRTDEARKRQQNFIAAPGLKAPMNGFVVRIALRQHVPLRASVEYPQYSFENTSGRDRLASRTSIGDVLFRKMIPDALPLLVCQPNHPTFIADRLRLAILR